MNSEIVMQKRRKVAAVGGAIAASVAGIAMTCIESDYIPREPYFNRDGERSLYLDGIINSEPDCHHMLRMNKEVFVKFVAMFRDRKLLCDTRNVKVEEQVAEFLHTIGHNIKYRVINHTFMRSGETVSRYFHAVLKAVLSVQNDFIKQPTSDTSTHPKIKNNPRFSSWFKKCVGAIDGTHIRASVPENIRNRFRGRKAFPTQNVLAAIDFDLKFTYVLAGWEGSAHDSRILEDALTRINGLQTLKEMRLQKTLEVWKMGMVNYVDALKLQQKLVSDRKLGKIPDTLISLQHPPTYTLGKRNTYQNLLVPEDDLKNIGAELHYTQRGGDITYHGPHQAILYPIISLRGLGLGARKYVENLEQVMIEFSSLYGVEARPGNKCETGVWVGDRKIGAIGVQISSGFTSHGLAYNIDPNMDYFKHIVPCGIKSKGVTSLKLETDKILPDDEVIHEELVSCFARIYGFDNVVHKKGEPVFMENEE